MATTVETIRRITIQASTQGVDQATRSLEQMENAHQGVVSVTQNTTRATTSVTQAYERLRIQTDQSYRSQVQFDKGLTTLNRAFDQNIIDINEYNKSLALLEQRLRAADRAQEGFSRSSSSVRSTGGIGSNIGGNIQAGIGGLQSLVALAGVSLGVGQIIEFSDAWTQANNSLKVAGLSGERLTGTLSELFDISQTHGTELGSTVQLYSRLSQSAKDLGASEEELMRFTSGVGAALKVAGTSTEAASGALLQLSQAMGSAVVRAEEFNSINEGARPILQAVANGIDEAGGSISKLRDLVLAGQITNKEFFDGFLEGSRGLQEQAAKTESTFGQAFTRMTNSITQFIGQINEGAAASPKLIGAINDLSSAMDRNGDTAKRWGDSIANTLSALPGRIESLRSDFNDFFGVFEEIGRESGLHDFVDQLISDVSAGQQKVDELFNSTSEHLKNSITVAKTASTDIRAAFATIPTEVKVNISTNGTEAAAEAGVAKSAIEQIPTQYPVIIELNGEQVVLDAQRIADRIKAAFDEAATVIENRMNQAFTAAGEAPLYAQGSDAGMTMVNGVPYRDGKPVSGTVPANTSGVTVSGPGIGTPAAGTSGGISSANGPIAVTSPSLDQVAQNTGQLAGFQGQAVQVFGAVGSKVDETNTTLATMEEWSRLTAQDREDIYWGKMNFEEAYAARVAIEEQTGRLDLMNNYFAQAGAEATAELEATRQAAEEMASTGAGVQQLVAKYDLGLVGTNELVQMSIAAEAQREEMIRNQIIANNMLGGLASLPEYIASVMKDVYTPDVYSDGSTGLGDFGSPGGGFGSLSGTSVGYGAFTPGPDRDVGQLSSGFVGGSQNSDFLIGTRDTQPSRNATSAMSAPSDVSLSDGGGSGLSGPNQYRRGSLSGPAQDRREGLADRGGEFWSRERWGDAMHRDGSDRQRNSGPAQDRRERLADRGGEFWSAERWKDAMRRDGSDRQRNDGSGRDRPITINVGVHNPRSDADGRRIGNIAGMEAARHVRRETDNPRLERHN